VLRLPCYQPSFRRRAVAERAPTRAEAGLPEGAMVYCCFNGVHKLNRFTFERWLAVLSRVPGSVLWLLSSNEATNERLRAYAEQCGVAKERLVFAGKLANPVHLARYQLADLFLDTAPYGAHTTASDALFMGVPVLTFAGRSFAARVCGSLVTAAGLPELVCDSGPAFVDRAVHLGTHRGELAELARRLESGRSTCTLFDTPLLVRELEGLFQQMWHEQSTGQLPRPRLQNLDRYLEVGASFEPDRVEAQGAADYEELWRGELGGRHLHRPLDLDGRLVTEDAWARWSS
jgi:predicted O-linked N-acetylglucosamine transferase (SPINDLY family)